MKRVRRAIGRFVSSLTNFGIDLRAGSAFIRALPWYYDDLHKLEEQQKKSPLNFPLGQNRPILLEKGHQAGTARGHYFFQDLIVAQRVFANQPTLHVDVGSRIDGFVAHVASFRSIEILDIRPMQATLPNIRFKQCDLMAELEPSLVGYSDSLSCLHALEHFGLGRYGDPIAFDGYIKGFDNLHRILRAGGTFYFSVPMGPQRIEFNAHRVFSTQTLLELIEPRYQIERFSYVDDKGDLFDNVALAPDKVANNFGCTFGCGIFELTKR